MGKKLVIHSFLSKVLATVSGVILVVLTSRWLGAEIRGEISLVLTWAGAWVMLSDFVTGSALINLSAKYNSLTLWRIAAKWLLLITFLATLIHLFLPSNQTDYFWIVPILLLIMGLYNTQGALLIGKGKLNERNYSFTAISIITLISFSILTFVYGKENINSLDYFICLLIGWVVSSIYTYIVISPFFMLAKSVKKEPLLTEIVFKTGAKSQSGHLVQYAASRLPFILMPFLFGKEQLGIYANAVVLGEGLLIITASFGQILHSKLIHFKGLGEAVSQIIKYAQLSLLLVLPSVLLVFLIPSSFWMWLLREEFATLGVFFILYSPVLIFQSVSSILSHAYHAVGRFEILIKANSIGLFFGMTALLVLSTYFGVKGFILGVGVGYFAQFIFLILSFCKEFRVSPIQFIPQRSTLAEIRKFLKRQV